MSAMSNLALAWDEQQAEHEVAIGDNPIFYYEPDEMEGWD